MDCTKNTRKNLKIYLRDLKTHMSPVAETLTNFVSCCGKVFIHIDGRERFNETLPTKKEFYSNLAMESITNAVYKYA